MALRPFCGGLRSGSGGRSEQTNSRPYRTRWWPICIRRSRGFLDRSGSSARLVGWTAFALAVVAAASPQLMWLASLIAAFGLYRGVCFTHELAHLRRRALPGFETAWNILFGVPLLLPSFTYLGVHQSHHSLSSYGTKEDPEYLPFASSRRLMMIFAIQSTLLMPIALFVRFLVLAPIGARLAATASMARSARLVIRDESGVSPDGQCRDGGQDATMGDRDARVLGRGVCHDVCGGAAVSRIRHVAGRSHDHQPAEYGPRARRTRVRQRGRDSQPARPAQRFDRYARRSVDGAVGACRVCATTRCTTTSLAFPITTSAPPTGASSHRCRGTRPYLESTSPSLAAIASSFSTPKRCACCARMTHFGIISPPVPGHIHPFAALGRELISRGHRVTYLQMIDLEEKIHSEGIDFEASGIDRSSARLSAGLARSPGQVEGAVGPAFHRPGRGEDDRHGVPRCTRCHPPPEDRRAARRSDGARRRRRRGPSRHSVRHHLQCAGNQPRPDRAAPFQPVAVSRVALGGRAQCDRLRHLRLVDASGHARRCGVPGSMETAAARLSRRLVLQACADMSDAARIRFPAGRAARPFSLRRSAAPPAAAQMEFPWERLDGRPLVYASLGTLQNSARGGLSLFRRRLHESSMCSWSSVTAAD